MKFDFEDIEAFLGGAEPYEPPKADKKLVDLNTIMAAAVAIRVYDEMRRRASVGMSDAIKEAVDAVENLDVKGCEDACLAILHETTSSGPKTMPLDMKTTLVLAMTLVDAGRLRPPNGYVREDLDKAIQMNRMILMSMAGRLSEIEEKRVREEKSGTN